MNDLSTPNHQDFHALERLYALRFSCRGFLERPVPRQTIEEILRLAHLREDSFVPALRGALIDLPDP
jgi:hypothetical protein